MEPQNIINSESQTNLQNQVVLNPSVKINKKYYFLAFFLYTIILSILVNTFSVKEILHSSIFQSIFSLYWVVIFLILSAFAVREIISQNTSFSSSIVKAKSVGTIFFELIFVTTSAALFFSVTYFSDVGGHSEYANLGFFLLFVGFIIFIIFSIPVFYLISGKLLEKTVSEAETNKQKYDYRILPTLFLIIGIIFITDVIIFIFSKTEYNNSVNIYKNVVVESKNSGNPLKIKYSIKEEAFPLNDSSSSLTYVKTYNNIEKHILKDIDNDGIKDISYITQFYSKTKEENYYKSFLTVSKLDNSLLKKCLISSNDENILDFDIIDHLQNKNIVIFGYDESVRYFAKVFDLNSCELLAQYNEENLNLSNQDRWKRKDELEHMDKVSIKNGIATVEENYLQCTVDLTMNNSNSKIECSPKKYVPSNYVYKEPSKSADVDINGDGKTENISYILNPNRDIGGSKLIVKDSQGDIVSFFEDKSLYLDGINLSNFQDIDGDGILEYEINRVHFAGPKPATVFEFLGF